MEALFPMSWSRAARGAGWIPLPTLRPNEVCEPLCDTEKPTMQAPVEQGPEPVIFVSPEFDEIETLM